VTDETPTERYDAAGDAPTERLTPADAAAMDPATAAANAEVQEERKSRKTMIILGSIGGALLVILIILLILLLVRPGASVTPTGSPTPSPSGSSSSPTPTPTATTASPTPTPTATVAPPPPPPPSNDVEIDSFTAPSQVDCSAQTQNPVYIEFSWSSTNGIVAYFAVGATNDAEQNGMGWTLPPNGSTSDFPSGYFPYQYQCGNTSQTYTITIVGTNGSRESKQVTVTNVGDTF
jgi:hypothetical protein